jgi:hypothetical protein
MVSHIVPTAANGGRRPPAWRLRASGGRRMPGIWSRTDRGLESAPDALPVPYLHLAIRSTPSYSEMFGFEACRVSNPRRQSPDRR